MREAYTGREHCICNYSCSTSAKDYASGSGYSGRDSYDWSYLAFKNYNNIIDNSFVVYGTILSSKKFANTPTIFGDTPLINAVLLIMIPLIPQQILNLMERIISLMVVQIPLLHS